MSGNNRPNAQFYSGGASQQVSLRSFADAPLTFIAQSTGNFMRRHYIMTMAWALGLVIVTMGKGYASDAETSRQFDAALDEADRIEQTHVSNAFQRSDALSQQYYRAKGWFSCDARCQTVYAKYLDAQQQLKEAQVRSIPINLRCGAACRACTKFCPWLPTGTSRANF